MFKISSKYIGVTPINFINDKLDKFVDVLNQEALELERELIRDTPKGVSAKLANTWNVDYATMNQPRAIVSNNSSYLLPVEMGRAPGKGISLEGQKSVELWAKRVLQIKSKKGADADRKAFAKALSYKYYKFGRPAKGFIGLANEGETPSSLGQNVPENPINGSLLFNAFERIKRELNNV